MVGRYSFSFAVASGQALFIAPVMAGEAPLVKARGFGHGFDLLLMALVQVKIFPVVVVVAKPHLEAVWWWKEKRSGLTCPYD